MYSTLEDLPLGRHYGTVYADPPWRYANTSTRNAADPKYAGTMSVEEIAAWRVSDRVEAKAHLHLWTTNAFLFDARRVLDAWGFEYKSCFVWVKPQIGMGNYWRVGHEFMLLGVRGGLRFARRNARSWIEVSRSSHSRKPDAVRKLIETVSPGPRLELFGREDMPGWDVVGNQPAKELRLL